MRNIWIFLLLGTLLAGLEAKESHAAPSRKPPKYVEIIHTPPYTGEGGKTLEIEGRFRGEWLAKSVWLCVRIQGVGSFLRIRFKRWKKGLYVASVPKERVTFPGLEYYIESIDLKGRRHLHFASPLRPHRVVVRRASRLGVWQAKLDRHQGNRSSVGASFTYHNYGKHIPLSFEKRTQGYEQTDSYYDIEVWYTYRILGFFYDITFGWGHLRGQVPIENDNQTSLSAGLDYGFSKVFMEFHRYFGVEAKIVLGASDRGFEFGGGATVRFGNSVETHLDLGFEIISRLGYTILCELAWDTVPHFLMALRVEVTNMPIFDSRALAVNAFFKLHWNLHRHFHLFAHIGYGRRRDIPWGGPLVKAGALFHF